MTRSYSFTVATNLEPGLGVTCPLDPERHTSVYLRGELDRIVKTIYGTSHSVQAFRCNGLADAGAWS